MVIKRYARIFERSGVLLNRYAIEARLLYKIFCAPAKRANPYEGSVKALVILLQYL